jgi:hypothetical protein
MVNRFLMLFVGRVSSLSLFCMIICVGHGSVTAQVGVIINERSCAHTSQTVVDSCPVVLDIRCSFGTNCKVVSGQAPICFTVGQTGTSDVDIVLVQAGTSTNITNPAIGQFPDGRAVRVTQYIHCSSETVCMCVQMENGNFRCEMGITEDLYIARYEILNSIPCPDPNAPGGA